MKTNIIIPVKLLADEAEGVRKYLISAGIERPNKGNIITCIRTLLIKSLYKDNKIGKFMPKPEKPDELRAVKAG